MVKRDSSHSYNHFLGTKSHQSELSKFVSEGLFYRKGQAILTVV